jgi:hypothetical protein
VGSVVASDRVTDGGVSAVEPNGVHLTRRDGELNARLQGAACLDSEPMLRQILTGALNAAADPGGATGPPLGLVLDLSGLSFCDLRGLDVLADTVSVGRSVGVDVTVTGATPSIERVWRLLGCDLPTASRQGPKPSPSTTGPLRERAQHPLDSPVGRRLRVRILRLATRRR